MIGSKRYLRWPVGTCSCFFEIDTLGLPSHYLKGWELLLLGCSQGTTTLDVCSDLFDWLTLERERQSRNEIRNNRYNVYRTSYLYFKSYNMYCRVQDIRKQHLSGSKQSV